MSSIDYYINKLMDNTIEKLTKKQTKAAEKVE